MIGRRNLSKVLIAQEITRKMAGKHSEFSLYFSLFSGQAGNRAAPQGLDAFA
jgi:hypothetical protein